MLASNRLVPSRAATVLLASGFLVAALAAGGCSESVRRGGDAAPPTPAAVPAESGFLSDYSKLQATEQFASVKLYRDDSRKDGYRKLLVRPVEVWRSAESLLGDVPEEDLQYLADSLYQAIHQRLGRSFEMVASPGPGVLEIHLGFTLVTDPESSIDFFSTAVPVKNLARRDGPLAAGTRSFVRDCALEAEFSERTSMAPVARGQRQPKAVRAAFFDTRRGSETPKGQVESWSDVQAVFEKWAGFLDERLESLRDGTFKPRLTVAP
jgi:hypothetical protein